MEKNIVNESIQKIINMLDLKDYQVTDNVLVFSWKNRKLCLYHKFNGVDVGDGSSVMPYEHIELFTYEMNTKKSFDSRYDGDIFEKLKDFLVNTNDPYNME